jgi:hypothetical protein
MDFSVGWTLGMVGGSLFKRHLEISDGLCLDIHRDQSVWVRPLKPTGAAFNGQPLTAPVRLRMSDTLLVGEAGHLQLRGLLPDDTVPIGVLMVLTPAPTTTLEAVDRACGLLGKITQPRTLMETGERWRVFGLQRAARWLTEHGAPEAASLADRADRATVEEVVRALLPTKVDWADALGCFLRAEREVFSERLQISISDGAEGGNLMLVGPPPTPALEAAQEHLALLGSRMMQWLTTFDAALALTVARHLEADAAVAADASILERDETERALTSAGPTHQGDLEIPADQVRWVNDVIAIDGSLIISGDPVAVRLPKLQTVRGEVRVRQCPKLVSLELPSLRAVGALTVEENRSLLRLHLPALELSRDDVRVHGNEFLTELSMPQLERVRTIEITSNDSLPVAQAQALVAPYNGTFHENAGRTKQHPVDAWLPSAWHQLAERERLVRFRDELPEHAGLAELCLFDAVTRGEAETIEPAALRVIALFRGQRPEVSARLLLQGLRGIRPLRAERAALREAPALSSARDFQRAWFELLAPLETAGPEFRARLMTRLIGVHLVDGLEPALEWLEAKVAADDAPLLALERLFANHRSAVGDCVGLMRAFSPSATHGDLMAGTSSWLERRLDVAARELIATGKG